VKLKPLRVPETVPLPTTRKTGFALCEKTCCEAKPMPIIHLASGMRRFTDTLTVYSFLNSAESSILALPALLEDEAG
jgi:hypothetical protein